MSLSSLYDVSKSAVDMSELAVQAAKDALTAAKSANTQAKVALEKIKAAMENDIRQKEQVSKTHLNVKEKVIGELYKLPVPQGPSNKIENLIGPLKMCPCDVSLCFYDVTIPAILNQVCVICNNYDTLVLIGQSNDF